MKIKFLAVIGCMSIVVTSSCSSKASLPQSSPTETTTAITGDVIITMPKWSVSGFDVVDSYVNDGNDINKVLDDAVEAFNTADNGYQIVFKDYSEYYNSSMDGEGGPTSQSYSKIDFQLSMDLINGEQIDLIPKSVFVDNGKFNSLAEKGAFINLYSYMEHDQEVNLGSMNAHVLQLNEINGSLYYMPISFQIETLAGYTKYVGAKENWSFNDLQFAWRQMPENATFNGKTAREYVYMCLLRGELNSFIDHTKGTCNFDSPEFIEILDFCNSFPSSGEDKINNDWGAPIFLFPFNVDTFDDFHYSLWNESKDEITLVGYPSDNASGSFITIYDVYAINAKSSPEVQKGAWQFLKLLASYDVQYALGDFGFPINNDAFRAKGNEEIKKKGNKVRFQGGEEIDIGNLTQEEYERLITLINNTKSVNVGMDEEVFSIIEEELWDMFDNTQTTVETAKNIQNRVSLYLSENY